MKSVKLNNVTFRYPNGYTAIENISLEIEQGEKVAIIGQNGAGKTTTVKMMNGLLRPSEGKVFINEKDISNMTTATVSRKVGYIFQNPGDQLFNKTVYDEIAYTLRHDKLKDEEIDKIVKNAAHLCHVDEFLEINPYDLPFSLRKFITIAIAIANNCEIVILDEPTAGQDLFATQWLKEIMNKLSSQGKTVITITHDIDFVVDNFNRVIVMANKHIVGDDTSENIFWNKEILKEADIKPPVISQLSERLGLVGNIVKIDQFIDSAKL